MADPSADQLIQQLLESQFLSPEDATEITQASESFADLKKRLIERKIITQQQMEILTEGMLDALVIDHYRIEEILGAGGMGVVFRAVHQTLNREVALKIISSIDRKQPESKRDETLKRFQREAELLARLHHPNIAMAYDAACDRGIHFLAMEYVRGRNLSDQVRQDGIFDLGAALIAIRQTAFGLSYAHQNGIVHRDVKPSNLIVNEEVVLKVLDCGLARIANSFSQSEDGETMTELTISGVVMGTANYMSPEQAENVQQVDARSDIYSLGCTLWFLLTGGPLHEADSALQTILKHREQPTPLLRDVRDDADEDLQTIFATMVEKQPEDRYQTMAEVMEDIDRYIEQKFGPEGLPPELLTTADNAMDVSSSRSVSSSTPTFIQKSKGGFGSCKPARNLAETSIKSTGFRGRSNKMTRTVISGLLVAFAMILFVVAVNQWGSERGLATATDDSSSDSQTAIAEAEFGPNEIIDSFDLWNKETREVRLIAPISRQASSRSEVELGDHYRLEVRMVREPAPRAPFDFAGTTHFEMKIGKYYFEFYLNNGGDQPIDNPSNGFLFLNGVHFSKRRVESSPDIIKERFLREHVEDHIIFEVHADEESNRGRVVLSINGEEKYLWDGKLSSFETIDERFDNQAYTPHLTINQWNGICVIRSVSLEPLPGKSSPGKDL